MRLSLSTRRVRGALSVTMDLMEPRYERKFLITEEAPHRVIDRIRFHPAGFRPIYRPRWVNNVYFDTEEMSLFQANLDGLSESRPKVRLRWYGELYGRELEASLEIKQRFGWVNVKEQFPIGRFFFTPQLEQQQFLNTVFEDRAVRNRFMSFDPLRPLLINRYFREYFLNEEGNFRITVDRGLYFSRYLYWGASAIGISCDEVCVLEMKYGVQEDGLANQITSLFPYRLSKSSKYVMGVEKVTGISETHLEG